MRVLVLATTLPTVRDDGTPQFVLDLSQGLAADMDVTIVAPRVSGGARRERMGDVEVVRIPYLPARWERLADGAMLPNIRQRPALALQAPFLFLALLVGALRELRRKPADVLHAHWIVPGGFLAAILNQMTGTPYVVTGHGADVFALRGRLMTRIKSWICSKASAIGAASTSLAEVLPDTTTPVEVIPMGVNIEDIQTDVGRPSPEPGRVLFIGRLASKKGIPVLLRATARIPRATVVVGGDGPDASDLRALAAELGIEARVHFPGRLSRTAVKDELRNAAVLVVPSLVADDGDQDTTPLVMSEAMAAGVPVIVSELGGLAEQVEEGVSGLLAPPGDVDGLTSALHWALDHPGELARMAAEARRRITGSAIDIATTSASYRRMLIEAAGSSTARVG